MIWKGSLIGIFSGIVLGLFLKVVEAISSIKVYTLLLNVDFIPVIGEVVWPEIIEFIFHLIISVIIGIVFVYILNMKRFQPMTFRRKALIGLILTLPTIPLYFPLTMLSIKQTPAVNDVAAITYWVIGHLLYAISLPLFELMLKRK